MSTIDTSLAKRPRMDQSDFWDDDFDGDAIEDCFNKATQEKQSQNEDITLLTSYSIFKGPQQMLTSTQLPQTSRTDHVTIETKVKELEKKCAEKEGEASILRSNLMNLRISCNVDLEKNKLQWQEKMVTAERENKTFRSELELKKLEIANLKQQISELSKVANVEQCTTQKPSVNVNISSQEKGVKESSSGHSRICINQAKLSWKERDFTNSWLNCFKTTSFYLQNIHEVEKIIENFDKQHAFYSAMNYEDVNAEKSFSCISKVVSTFLQLMDNFRTCLKEIEESSPRISEKCDRECNLQFLRNSRLTKISLIMSTIIEFFGEVLSYHSNLRDFLLAECSDQMTKAVPSETVEGAETCRLFNQLSQVVTQIRRVGKEKECSIFLFAVVTLLCKLVGSEDFTSLPKQHVEDILNDLLLLNHVELNDLIGKISRLLNIITHTSNFNINFCSHDEENASRKGVCRFQVFITSMENALLDVKNHGLFLNISSNILDLTYNIFRAEKQGNKACSCIIKLSKLAIGIIYRHLVLCETHDSKIEPLSKNCTDILRLLIFNAFDLTQKDVTDIVQFKEIMYRLNNMESRHLKHLEKMCLSDDFSTLPREKFTDINL